MQEKTHPTLIENILEHARWAPSGDNMQTWKFNISNEHNFVIKGHDTREHCVYDLKGRASQLAIGALMESISIAASAYQHTAEFNLQEGMIENELNIDVKLIEDSLVEVDPLFSVLPKRSVQRRAFKTKPLSIEQIEKLEKSIASAYTVKWLNQWQQRCRAAVLMFKNGKLRLTLPEAYPTHSTIIEWGVRYSKDKIPDKAVGLDPLAVIMMKWALKSWERVRFLNTYFAGTLLPRIQLDLIPGICCGAHFMLVAENEPETVKDYLNAGRSVQRFWLTATELGLQLQPEMTPLIFSGYIDKKIPFTKEQNLQAYAKSLSKEFTKIFGQREVKKAVFMGRIGHGKPAYARSVRFSTKELINRSSESTSN